MILLPIYQTNHLQLHVISPLRSGILTEKPIRKRHRSSLVILRILTLHLAMPIKNSTLFLQGSSQYNISPLIYMPLVALHYHPLSFYGCPELLSPPPRQSVGHYIARHISRLHDSASSQIPTPTLSFTSSCK
ncbi:hypothetical protein U1Q18_052781 [Sarracenia purpurea var. burkii]